MNLTLDMQTQDSSEVKKGESIVIASGKGGVGKTVISTNLAVELANKGFSTCIIDGSFQFGDVNLALDIQPKFTISDILKDITSLNKDILYNYLQLHDSGVRVLSAPVKPEYADLINASIVKTLCEKILENFDYLIVDLSSGFSENNISFMECAEKIFVVSDLEMAALKNTKGMIKTLNALELGEKIRVVVNRADMESVIKFKDVAAILETENLFYISNNFKVVSKSFNIGIPFVISKPKENISDEISNLANEIYKHKFKHISKRRRRKPRTCCFFFKRK